MRQRVRFTAAGERYSQFDRNIYDVSVYGDVVHEVIYCEAFLVIRRIGNVYRLSVDGFYRLKRNILMGLLCFIVGKTDFCGLQDFFCGRHTVFLVDIDGKGSRRFRFAFG